MILTLVVVPAGGVLFLSWKDMSAGIPDFAELREAKVNSWRADIAREVWNPASYSIEFFDEAGRRYQARGVSKPAVDEIAAARPTQVPVVIRYGRWRSVFRSARLQTVYQLEVGDKAVIRYEDVARTREREHSARPWILLVTLLVAAGAMVMAVRRERAFRRQLGAGPRGNEEVRGGRAGP